ncbi:UNVERIFIED_CONTAM: hypothetical protein K2H54_037763 [Gekko kuhli]
MGTLARMPHWERETWRCPAAAAKPLPPAPAPPDLLPLRAIEAAPLEPLPLCLAMEQERGREQQCHCHGNAGPAAPLAGPPAAVGTERLQ